MSAPDAPDERVDEISRDRIARLDAHYRKIARGLIAGCVVFALAIGLGFAGLLKLDSRQRAGRRAAVQIVCGATSGVIEAGRETILGAARQHETAFERRLERLGYPPRRVRAKQAEAAARAYARMIATRTRDVADGKAKGVVGPDGTLDCKRLERVASTS